MANWFDTIFTGSNDGLKTDTNQSADLANYSSNVGEGATNTANNFYQDILSGDPAKIGQVLGPQIKAIQGQGQQAKQVGAQFGNRGGGTNATNQNIDDKTRGSVNDLVSSLTGQAASGEQSIGSTNLSQALNANQVNANESETQMQNFINSILGKTIGQGVGAATTGLIGGLGTEVSTLGSGNFGW